MSEMIVYMKRKLLEEIARDNEKFKEYIVQLYGIYGKWENVANYEPLHSKYGVSGKTLMNCGFIPREYGMLLGMKVLCKKYGEDNFIFASKAFKFKDDEEALEWIGSDELLNDMRRSAELAEIEL